jgi:hypothetical protein
VIYYTEAFLLILLSFLLFIVKRTSGVDPHMVSGAYDGTTQLTFFVVINITALMLGISAHVLYKFSGEDSGQGNSSGYLRLYFKITGIFSIPLFCIAVSAVFYFVLG